MMWSFGEFCESWLGEGRAWSRIVLFGYVTEYVIYMDLFQRRLVFWAFGSWMFDLTAVLHYCCWWGQLESAVCGNAAAHIVTVRKWHFTGQQFGTSERRNINPVRPTALYVPRDLTFTNSTFWPHSVFCVDLGTNSDYFNWLVCITERECLLRGTDWVFKYNTRYFDSRP